jgi:hypothetical protein
MTVEQLELTGMPEWPSRRGEPVAAFVLKGDPQPWTRPSPFQRPGRAYVEQRFVGPFAKWRKAAIHAVTGWWWGQGHVRPIQGVPLVVEIVAVYARPAAPPVYTIGGLELAFPWRWVPGRVPSLAVGDVDNLAKAVLDVAQQHTGLAGALLSDDRLVQDLRVCKVYAREGEEPRTEVRIWRAA